MDGLKTGHTEIAGYGIVLSAKQSDSQRLVLVINGLPSEKAREEEGADILGWGFATFAQVTIAKEGAEVARQPVWLGTSDVSLVGVSDINVTVPRTKQEEVKTNIIPNETIEAPIEKGQELAMLEISVPDAELVRVPLVAGHDVKRKGFFGRMADKARRIVGGK